MIWEDFDCMSTCYLAIWPRQLCSWSVFLGMIVRVGEVSMKFLSEHLRTTQCFPHPKRWPEIISSQFFG